MAGEVAVRVLLHFKPSSVEIGEGDLRRDAGMQMMKSVQLLHGSGGHAVAVAENARGRPDVWRIPGAGGHRCTGATDAAAGVVAVLPHHVPSPFCTRVLEPHLDNAKPTKIAPLFIGLSF